MKKYIALLLFANASFGQTANFDLPIVTESVSDFEEIFSTSEEDDLRNLINSILDQKKISIAVVTVKSIDPFNNIVDYSLLVANKSKVGQLIIVVCAAKGAAHIQSRDSATSLLTADESSLILSQYILSEFKKGNYYDGISTGIREIAKEFIDH